jgi:hypothetical protein
VRSTKKSSTILSLTDWPPNNSEERADEDKDNRIVAERLIPAKAKK